MSRRVLLLILIAGFSAVRAHTPETQTRFALSLACFAQYFLLGLLMADGFITVLPKLKESWLWDLAAVPLWVITFVVRDTVADYILPAILLVTFTAAFKGVLFRRFWRNPFVTTVGGMCYSLYLTHSLVLQACYMALRMLHLPNGYYFSYMWGVIIALPLILLVGGTFYVLIERPCMNKEWPRHLLLSLRQRTGIGVAS